MNTHTDTDRVTRRKHFDRLHEHFVALALAMQSKAAAEAELQSAAIRYQGAKQDAESARWWLQDVRCSLAGVRERDPEATAVERQDAWVAERLPAWEAALGAAPADGMQHTPKTEAAP